MVPQQRVRVLEGADREKGATGVLLSGPLVRKLVILEPTLAGIFLGSLKSCCIKSYPQPSEVFITVVILQRWKPRLKDARSELLSKSSAPGGALAAGEAKGRAD